MFYKISQCYDIKYSIINKVLPIKKINPTIHNKLILYLFCIILENFSIFTCQKHQTFFKKVKPN